MTFKPPTIVVPLTPAQAANTVTHRLGRVADNIRQVATRLGARPYRCFLVWSTWTNGVRGEGEEVETMRTEILPTPVVTSMDQIALNPQNVGLVQIGDVKVTEISVSFTEDQLMGRLGGATQVEQPQSFAWEIIEDGRQRDNPVHTKFRVKGRPVLKADQAMWSVNLERVGDDRQRDGSPQGEPQQ